MHQAPRQARDVTVRGSSSNGSVAFEDLLEVAERAAKAGAAVCLFGVHVPILLLLHSSQKFGISGISP